MFRRKERGRTRLDPTVRHHLSILEELWDLDEIFRDHESEVNPVRSDQARPETEAQSSRPVQGMHIRSSEFVVLRYSILKLTPNDWLFKLPGKRRSGIA